MKNMTSSAALALVVGMFTILPATAQDQNSAERSDGLEQRLDYLDEKLDLTDVQEEQIRSLMVERRDAMRPASKSDAA